MLTTRKVTYDTRARRTRLTPAVNNRKATQCLKTLRVDYLLTALDHHTSEGADPASHALLTAMCAFFKNRPKQLKTALRESHWKTQPALRQLAENTQRVAVATLTGDIQRHAEALEYTLEHRLPLLLKGFRGATLGQVCITRVRCHDVYLKPFEPRAFTACADTAHDAIFCCCELPEQTHWSALARPLRRRLCRLVLMNYNATATRQRLPHLLAMDVPFHETHWHGGDYRHGYTGSDTMIFRVSPDNNHRHQVLCAYVPSPIASLVISYVL